MKKRRDSGLERIWYSPYSDKGATSMDNGLRKNKRRKRGKFHHHDTTTDDEGFTRRQRKRRTKRTTDFYHEGTKSRRTGRDGISHREHGAAAAKGDERRFSPRSCEVAKKYLCRQDACGTRSVTQASRPHRFICAKDQCNVNLDVHI